MENITWQLIAFSGFAGITVLFGGLLSYWFDHHVENSSVKPIIVHSIMALGGGIILSAVALVLIPAGLETLPVIPMSISFIAGTIGFAMLDKYLDKLGGQMGTVLAMMMDFIPESIALGAMFVADPKAATLLAVFIGLQNLPEAFSSYRDVVQSGFSPMKTLIIFFGLSFFGILGAIIGVTFLQDSPTITAHLMVFSGGGILYLLFQDIIPKSSLSNTSIISICGTIGFLIGVIGEMTM